MCFIRKCELVKIFERNVRIGQIIFDLRCKLGEFNSKGQGSCKSAFYTREALSLAISAQKSIVEEFKLI